MNDFASGSPEARDTTGRIPSAPACRGRGALVLYFNSGSRFVVVYVTEADMSHSDAQESNESPEQPQRAIPEAESFTPAPEMVEAPENSH